MAPRLPCPCSSGSTTSRDVSDNPKPEVVIYDLVSNGDLLLLNGDAKGCSTWGFGQQLAAGFVLAAVHHAQVPY